MTMLCERIPTFQFIRDSDKANGLDSLKGEFNTYTKAIVLEGLEGMHDDQATELRQKYAEHCRIQIKHAIMFAHSCEERMTSGRAT